jgi:hypothetical protein
MPPSPAFHHVRSPCYFVMPSPPIPHYSSYHPPDYSPCPPVPQFSRPHFPPTPILLAPPRLCPYVHCFPPFVFIPTISLIFVQRILSQSHPPISPYATPPPLRQWKSYHPYSTPSFPSIIARPRSPPRSLHPSSSFSFLSSSPPRHCPHPTLPPYPPSPPISPSPPLITTMFFNRSPLTRFASSVPPPPQLTVPARPLTLMLRLFPRAKIIPILTFPLMRGFLSHHSHAYFVSACAFPCPPLLYRPSSPP